jgi:hypothetical protein
MRFRRRECSLLSSLFTLSTRAAVLCFPALGKWHSCRSTRLMSTNQKRRKKNQSEDVESAAEGQSAFTDTRFATQQDEWKPPFPNPPPQTAPFPRSSFAVPSPKATTSNENWNTSIFNQNMPSPANRFPSVNSLQSSFLDSAGPSVPHDAASLPHSMTTPASMPDSTGSGAGLSPSQRAKRRRQHSPDATRRIVAASFSNETDALEILANAAAENDEDEHRRAADADELGRAVQWSSHTSAPKGLEDNCLVKAHILTTADVEHLVRMYFEDHHPGLVGYLCCQFHSTQLTFIIAHLPNISNSYYTPCPSPIVRR